MPTSALVILREEDKDIKEEIREEYELSEEKKSFWGSKGHNGGGKAILFEIPELYDTKPNIPKTQNIEVGTPREGAQTPPSFSLETVSIFSSLRNKNKDESTLEVQKENILAFHEFWASLKETLFKGEGLTLAGSSKLHNLYEEDIFDFEALKSTNLDIRIFIGRKTLKNEHLNLELQQMKEEVRSQKEAEEMIYVLHLLK